MRIACLHIPQFALQCATRVDPALRGAPVVVVGTATAKAPPTVLACSRAAWGLGARVGITVPAARAVSPELNVIGADAQLERDAVRAIADAVLSLASVVDVGGRTGAGGAHLAMYCDVPSKTRGTSFGERVLEKLDALGLTARVGIADDRFTAWVAASAHEAGRLDDAGVVSVPRGGSAAFLAPRPLSLLAISAEVQHMLEALGVRTLGEFAALPEPSVARPFDRPDADYQALARGEGGHRLRPYSPDAPIREEIAVGEGTSVPAGVALLAERVALRLAGRGRGVARIELAIRGPEAERMVPITPLARRTSEASAELALPSTAEEIAELVTAALHDHATVWRLRVAVTGEALAGSEPAVDADAGPALDAASEPAIVDALSLVLSSTGSAGGSLDLAFGGPLPAIGQPTGGILRAERREAHRRTRRGKQRRRESLVQPKLFKNLP